jgi:hypothetical protein
VQLIEIPVELVRVDEARFPDRDRSQVFEHLVAYLSLVDTLPAISVRVEPAGPVVTRGHKYLRAARRLGRPVIRAVVGRASAPDAVDALMRRPDVTELDWAAIEAAERAHPVAEQWHVFHFARPLDQAEKDRFAAGVAGFFATGTPPAGELLSEGERGRSAVVCRLPRGRSALPHRGGAHRQLPGRPLPAVAARRRCAGCS